MGDPLPVTLPAPGRLMGDGRPVKVGRWGGPWARAGTGWTVLFGGEEGRVWTSGRALVNPTHALNVLDSLNRRGSRASNGSMTAWVLPSTCVVKHGLGRWKGGGGSYGSSQGGGGRGGGGEETLI